MRFFKDIRHYFSYCIRAAKSQLKSEVANAYLDWLWWILEPLCRMIVYTIVFGIIFNAAEPNFPIFLFIGINMWGFFSKTLNSSVKLIKSNKSIVTKVYIPKQMLLIKLMMVNAFKMALSFFIIIIMMVIYRVPVSVQMIYAVPIFITLFILTYGISCLLMHCGVFVEDMAYVTSILLTMLMYFTGIFYSIKNRVPQPWGNILNVVNPMAYLISLMRDSLLYGVTDHVMILAVWFVVSVGLACFGTWIIYKNENSYVKVI